MFNLIKANLYKLLKEKPFYIITAIMLGLRLINTVIGAFMTVEVGGEVVSIYTAYDGFLNTFSVMNGAGFFAIITISVYLAKEFTQGAIRNKISVGHSRKVIYWSNIITAVLMSLLLVVVSALYTLIDVAVNDWGATESAALIVRQVVAGMIIIITSACVTTLISMLTRGNSGILFNILGVFALTIIFTIMGVQLEGDLWKVLNTIPKLLYIGQSSMLAEHTLSFFLYVLISGIIVSGGATIGGAYLFERLDIK